MRNDRSLQMRYIILQHSYEDIRKFQEEYWLVKDDRKQNTEKFLKEYINKPDYNDQLTVLLINFLEKSCLGFTNSSKNRDNYDLFQKAVNRCVNCLKVIHDHREKFVIHSTALKFETDLLKSIKYCVRTKTKCGIKQRFDMEKLELWKEQVNDVKLL